MLKVSIKVYLAIMQESEYLHGREDLVDRLRGFPFIQHMDTSHILDMLQLSKLRIYDANEVITPEGVFDSWIYVLVYGEVVVTKQGNELARLKDSGETFGELAVLDGEARSATVTATCKTKCLAIDASFLGTLPMEEQSAFYSIFYRLLAEILSKRLRDAGKELAECKARIKQLEQQ